tara:strand:+ start:1863 stop:2261 length:399 start_codon:yes stop_codon:yes gene_type:complete
MINTFTTPIGHIGKKDVWLSEIFISILIIIRLVSLILSIYIKIVNKESSTSSPSPSKQQSSSKNNITKIIKTIAILNNIFVVGSCFMIIWYFHPGGPNTVEINNIQKKCFFMLGIFILIPYIIDFSLLSIKS